MRRLIAVILAVLFVVVGLTVPVAAVYMPRTHTAPIRYVVSTATFNTAGAPEGCVTETQPVDAYSNPLHIHLWRVKQHITWCWRTTAKYPHGRVYGIEIGATYWTNPATPWVADGLQYVDQGYGRARAYYRTNRGYEFHMCVLWYCTHDYPWIEQIGMYGFRDGNGIISGYRCTYGFGNDDGIDCTFDSNPS